jgi:xeroderma pigmentosum group C-complementing protein
MPTTITGFKDHPLYALERHVKRDEIIYPRKEIGKFRGEPVYPRAYVLPVKSAEGWMRVGRKVREGCQPMKQVKQRAATVNRQREIELAMADGCEAVMQGMYALNQTELFRPDPVVNVGFPRGKVRSTC